MDSLYGKLLEVNKAIKKLEGLKSANQQAAIKTFDAQAADAQIAQLQAQAEQLSAQLNQLEKSNSQKVITGTVLFSWRRRRSDIGTLPILLIDIDEFLE